MSEVSKSRAGLALALPGTWLIRIGWVLSGLVIAFFLLDAGMKMTGADVSVSATVALGYPAHQVRAIGFILLILTGLYAIPRTSVLGALGATGYLGGAVAAQLRVESPLISHVLFGVYLGLMLWGGLYLREPRLRTLLPLVGPRETSF
ncbi:DoxX family protein [Parasphingorhabdus sp.]|uniref:DoxX family protein n=1 Tax=Parasphingorhabdus sp. TaxID=2709688 RepID=UPI002F952350